MLVATCFGPREARRLSRSSLDCQEQGIGQGFGSPAQETSSLGAVIRFVQRQVISARLHADSWPAMLVGSGGYFLASWLCWALLFAGMATRTWPMALGAAMVLIAHGLGSYVLLRTVEGLVRHGVVSRGT